MEPPEGSVPGDRVTVQGFEEEPDEQLNPKKKIFEQVGAQLLMSLQPALRVRHVMCCIV